MNTKEILAIAIQGKQAWNAWSENHTTESILLENVDFQQYAENIDFTGFVFPPISFDGSTFPSNTSFEKAEFNGWASFNGVNFKGNVSFVDTSFLAEVGFENVNFNGNTNFNGARLQGDAKFSGMSIDGNAQFIKTSFTGETKFNESSFHSSAIFNETTLNGVTFSEARFHGNTEFSRATFLQRAVFKSADFSRGANFNETHFKGAANFIHCTLAGSLTFTNTVFDYAPFFDGIEAAEYIVDLSTSELFSKTKVGKNTLLLARERLPTIRPALRLNAASTSAQLNEFRKVVRSDNYLRAENEEYHENLLITLDKLAVDLEVLPDILSDSDGPATEAEIEATASWYKRFLVSSTAEFDAYTSPEAMAKMAVPAGLILSIGTLGALIGPIVGIGSLGGFGAGTLLAKLAIGHAKPGELTDKIEKELDTDTQSNPDT